MDELLAVDGKRGGILPGFMHVLAGSQRFLSRVLARLAVMAQLPVVNGGANATRVMLAEFTNHFDPYLVSRVATEVGLSPPAVLDRIEIARGFNWDQCVEIAGRQLPRSVASGPSRQVIVVSGLTSMFDPAQPAHHDGLRDMIDGLKRCFHARPGLHVIATTPVAAGSTFKPAGGTHLAHFAGALVVVSQPRETPSGSKVTSWWLLQHPLLPERRVTSWEHPPAGTRSRRHRSRGDPAGACRSLDEFAGVRD